MSADPGARPLAILHVDLDAFFASVEQLLQPELRGRPVAVGGTGPRSVVAAASYEARRYGVHSAMPMVQARRLCADLVVCRPRFEEYERCSREVMGILREVTPLVEPLSLDEAFLDVAGAHRRLGDAPAIARHIRACVLDETGLVASVGVATTKFLAKIASDMAKPDGLLVIEAGTELEFLHPLPVRRLWGVGPKTAERLHRLGITTVGELARLPLEGLIASLGDAHGRHLHALAHNDDHRAVEPDHERKSVGAEETYARDLVARDDLDRELLRLADRVGTRLRDQGVRARTITLKVRFTDFHTISRSLSPGPATDSSAQLVRVARGLLDDIDTAPGVRLLGLSASNLVAPEEVSGEQLSLLDAAGAPVDAADAARRDERTGELERVTDEVRARFGHAALRPATLLPRADPPRGDA